MNRADMEYFEAHPHLLYRLRAWSEGDPQPFITAEGAPILFEGYVLTTVVRHDGEARVIWIDHLLHNRGVIRAEQIIDLLTTTPEKWAWAANMGIRLKPTLFAG